MKRLLTYITLLLFMVGCGGATTQFDISHFDKVLYAPTHASGFKVLHSEQTGATLITVSDPWQGANNVEQMLIIDPEGNFSALPSNVKRIGGAAKRIVCMSSSHVAMLAELGMSSAVAGVSGKQYITNEAVANNPAVKDIGYDSNLNYEALVLLNPDVVLMYGVSAANDAVTAKLRDLGIPYLYLGDYTEELPLGKAEWVVAIAEIMGCRERGEDVFAQIAQRYNEVRDSVVRSDEAPKVMFNLPYQDVWYMPSDESYMVRLVEDSGGEYIYKGRNQSSGSVGISLEEAYMLATEADVWMNVGQCSSLEELRSAAPHFANLPVVVRGAVYNNNARATAAGGSDFWESAIVRPDVVLSDLVTIIAGGNNDTYYYQHLQ